MSLQLQACSFSSHTTEVIVTPKMEEECQFHSSPHTAQLFHTLQLTEKKKY
jgi:hypothetical protein